MARGYIRERGEKRYQLVYDAPRGADGKRRQQYKTVSGTKRQAQARLTQILQNLNRGDYAEPTTLTVAQYFDPRRLDGHVISRRRPSPRGCASAAKSRC